jgi:hypothetical protein
MALLIRFTLSVSIVTTGIFLGMLVFLHLFFGMGFIDKIQQWPGSLRDADRRTGFR